MKTNFKIGEYAAEYEPMVVKATEKVNHPSHYNFNKKETIDIIDDFCTDEEFIGFLKGNILKYIHRYSHKNGLEDLNKAKWYIEKLISLQEKKPDQTGFYFSSYSISFASFSGNPSFSRSSQDGISKNLSKL